MPAASTRRGGQRGDVVERGFADLDGDEIAGPKPRCGVEPGKQQPPGLPLAHLGALAVDPARGDQIDARDREPHGDIGTESARRVRRRSRAYCAVESRNDTSSASGSTRVAICSLAVTSRPSTSVTSDSVPAKGARTSVSASRRSRLGQRDLAPRQRVGGLVATRASALASAERRDSTAWSAAAAASAAVSTAASVPTPRAARSRWRASAWARSSAWARAEARSSRGDLQRGRRIAHFGLGLGQVGLGQRQRVFEVGRVDPQQELPGLDPAAFLEPVAELDHRPAGLAADLQLAPRAHLAEGFEHRRRRARASTATTLTAKTRSRAGREKLSSRHAFFDRASGRSGRPARAARRSRRRGKARSGCGAGNAS